MYLLQSLLNNISQLILKIINKDNIIQICIYEYET